MRKNVKFKDNRFNFKQKKRTCDGYKDPISLTERWGFIVFRPDEHDFQILCNHENSKVRKKAELLAIKEKAL